MRTHDYIEGEKNPNDTSFTCLELFCKFKGYQGGTIHQAFTEFNEMPIEEKDKFCNILMNNMFNICDLNTMQDFMNLRIKHLG